MSETIVFDLELLPRMMFKSVQSLTSIQFDDIETVFERMKSSHASTPQRRSTGPEWEMPFFMQGEDRIFIVEALGTNGKTEIDIPI